VIQRGKLRGGSGSFADVNGGEKKSNPSLSVVQRKGGADPDAFDPRHQGEEKKRGKESVFFSASEIQRRETILSSGETELDLDEKKKKKRSIERFLLRERQSEPPIRRVKEGRKKGSHRSMGLSPFTIFRGGGVVTRPEEEKFASIWG